MSACIVSRRPRYEPVTFVIDAHLVAMGHAEPREVRAHKLELEDGCLVFRGFNDELIKVISDWSQVEPK